MEKAVRYYVLVLYLTQPVPPEPYLERCMVIGFSKDFYGT